MQGTSPHSVFGYVALKHPSFLGRGVRDMVACQASRLWSVAGEGGLEAGTPGSAEIARLAADPNSRVARPMMVRTFAARSRIPTAGTLLSADPVLIGAENGVGVGSG